MKSIKLMVNSSLEKPSSLNYVVEGQGPPVILIHGIAASLYDWRYLIPALVDNGYRTYAPDLLGHGDSPKPDEPEDYHIDSLARHLTRWIDSLELDQPATLIGHSLGGYLSLHYTINHPKNVKGLVLIDPFYESQQLPPILRAVNRRPDLVEKAMRMIPPWVVNKFMSLNLKPMNEYNQTIRQQMAEDYQRVSPHFIQITNSVPELNGKLDKVYHPTLVLWGDSDITLNPQSFPKLVDRLPDARGQEIADCGHQPHLAKPNTFDTIVLNFLAGLLGE